MASKTLASLVVRIGADVTGVTAGLSTLDKRVRSTKKQFSSVTDSTLKWQSALGVLAGATGLAYASKKVFDLGASIEETASKFRTVMGPAVGEAQAFLDEFAHSAGLTNAAGQDLLATAASITQGLGFTQEASADVSQQMVRMAADIASFHNTQGGAEAVTQSLISALNGETESLKNTAKVVILQADVMEKAAEMTGKATDEITRQDKALATLELVAERSGVAMGDLARTMDSPANRARKITAEFLELRDSIAHGLLPVFGVILEELDGSAGGFSNLAKSIGDNGAKIEAWARFAVAAFKTVAKAIAAPFQIAFNLGQVLGELANIVGKVLVGDFAGAKEAGARLVGNFTDMKNVVTGVIDGFDDMRIKSGEAWQTFGEGTEAADALASGLDGVASAANNAAAAIGSIPNIDFRDLNPRALVGRLSAREQRRRLFEDQRSRYGDIATSLEPRLGGAGGSIPGSGSQGSRFGNLREHAGKAAGYLGVAGNALPGKAGNIVNAIGGVASAFATGGPLLGGIAAAGLAFKGLKSLFGGGKDKMELFMESVKRARQTLDLQFGLMDADTAERQWELTLKQAQKVFDGQGDAVDRWLASFFEGLTPENIQERVNKLLDKGWIDLGTESEIGKAFLDFISRLESLADATEKVTSAFKEAVNIPIAVPLAYLRQQAGNAPSQEFGGKDGHGGVVDPGGFGRRPSGVVYNITVNGAVSPIETANAVMTGIRMMKGAGQSIELDRHYQLRPA